MKAWLKDTIAFLNGYRKWTIMILILVTGIVFRVTDLVNGAEFVDLIKGTAVAFFSFNGIEHLTGSVKEWLKSKYKESSNVDKKSKP